MDRKILTNLIFAMVLACAAPEYINAQEYISTPVTVSKEKVRVNGKICYSHIVKEKQTLFSIAKAYKVTVDDIYAFNPTLKETGLKKNSIILIPSPEAVAAKISDTKADTAEVIEEDTKEVTTEDMPEVKEAKEEIKEVEEIKETKETKKKKQTTHTVKWYEDLDVIAEKYGVTVEAIMKANNLTGRKLSKRQKLVIPEPGEPAVTDVPTQNEAAVAKLHPILTHDDWMKLLSASYLDRNVWIADESRRRVYYKEIINCGKREELLGMISALHHHKSNQIAQGRKFHISDENFLRDAEKVICSEISLVLDMPMEDAYKYIRETIK